MGFWKRCFAENDDGHGDDDDNDDEMLPMMMTTTTMMQKHGSLSLLYTLWQAILGPRCLRGVSCVKLCAL